MVKPCKNHGGHGRNLAGCGEIEVNTDPANAAVASDFGSVLSAMNALLLRSLFADSAALVSDLTAWHPAARNGPKTSSEELF